MVNECYVLHSINLDGGDPGDYDFLPPSTLCYLCYKQFDGADGHIFRGSDTRPCSPAKTEDGSRR